MDFSKINLHKLDGNVSFCPTAKQKLFLNTITETNVTSVLTRQQGFTTVQNIAAISQAIENPDSIVVIISHNNYMSVSRMESMKNIIHDIGKEKDITRCTKNRIELSNGSIIKITSLRNVTELLRGVPMKKVFVAIDLRLDQSNLYNVSILIQMLIQMESKFTIGLMLHKPANISKNFMKVFNTRLTSLMTMLRYNSTFVDFPVVEYKKQPFLTPTQYKQEYKLFSYTMDEKDPTGSL